LDQVNGGETFSPTQFGLDLSFPANFFASLPLSSKADELSTNVSEPEVGPSAAKDAEAAMAAMKYVTAALTATSSPASDESSLLHNDTIFRQLAARWSMRAILDLASGCGRTISTRRPADPPPKIAPSPAR
jgi:hypothetical protein